MCEALLNPLFKSKSIKVQYRLLKSKNPPILWSHCEYHNLHGQAAVNSTNFVDKLWIPPISSTRRNYFHYFLEIPASTGVVVHLFRGIQKSFPTATRTTTTNKPFLKPRQRSLAVKNNLGIEWKYLKPKNLNPKESFASKLSNIKQLSSICFDIDPFNSLFRKKKCLLIFLCHWERFLFNFKRHSFISERFFSSN